MMSLIAYDVNRFGDDERCHPCEHSRMEGLARRIRELSKDFESMREMSLACGLAGSQLTTILAALERPKVQDQKDPKKKNKGEDISARILAKIASGCHVSLHWLVLGEGDRRVRKATEADSDPEEFVRLDMGPEHRDLARLALAQGASIVDIHGVLEGFAEDLKMMSAGQFYDLIKRRRDERLDAKRTIRAGGRVDIALASAPLERNMQLGEHPDRGATIDDALRIVKTDRAPEVSEPPSSKSRSSKK